MEEVLDTDRFNYEEVAMSAGWIQAIENDDEDHDEHHDEHEHHHHDHDHEDHDHEEGHGHGHHHHHHHHGNESPARILTAFLLNLCFSVFELVGGILTGSVAILSDALHDLGDAAGIGLAYILEKKSRKAPDATHTYGYARYSVLGGLLTTMILTLGSCAVIYHAVLRLLHPTPIHYNGMLIFAVVGVAVNLIAALCTRHGESLNQRAVNLHMLEDVLGWTVVLVGAVVMRFTDWTFLDPLMSIGVAVFILIHALGNLKEILRLFLDMTPEDISVEELTEHLASLEGVERIHRMGIRSLDGTTHCATLHVTVKGDTAAVKAAIREELAEHGITEVTIETIEGVERVEGGDHADTK